jgi:hypothetical protein
MDTREGVKVMELTDEEYDSYEAWVRDCEEDERLKAEALRAAPLGRRKEWEFCDECGCLSVEVHIIPTRQYGGGYNTTYQCHFCDWKDVAV